jgi:hypothetical protein
VKSFAVIVCRINALIDALFGAWLYDNGGHVVAYMAFGMGLAFVVASSFMEGDNRD